MSDSQCAGSNEAERFEYHASLVRSQVGVISQEILYMQTPKILLHLW